MGITSSWSDVVEIKKPTQLAEIDRLVIPGGESTALLKLMAPWDFLAAIKNLLLINLLLIKNIE